MLVFVNSYSANVRNPKMYPNVVSTVAFRYPFDEFVHREKLVMS